MEADIESCVLAIDPGHDKCGLALVDSDGQCVRREIVPRHQLLQTIGQWMSGEGPLPRVAVVGDRTGSDEVVAEIRKLCVFEAVETIDEHRSTEEARQLYFGQQQRRGLKRLIPVGLLLPPGPLDDYSAWILGRRFVARRSKNMRA